MVREAAGLAQLERRAAVARGERDVQSSVGVLGNVGEMLGQRAGDGEGSEAGYFA